MLLLTLLTLPLLTPPPTPTPTRNSETDSFPQVILPPRKNRTEKIEKSQKTKKS